MRPLFTPNFQGSFWVLKPKSRDLLPQNLVQIYNFNSFACFWPKSYQRRSLGKSHQNGDYLKTNNAKELSSYRIRTCNLWIIKPATFGLPITSGADLYWALGEIICNFTPILPHFQHWGGGEARSLFFHVSKSSENKKKIFTKNLKSFLSPKSSEDQKKSKDHLALRCTP